jgi:hypothetical protein
MLDLQAQKEVFETTFAKLSGMILSSWALPEVLWSPLLELEDVDAALGQDASVLLTSHLMTTLEQGSEILQHPLVPQSLIDDIGLTPDDYDIIFEFATAESLKIAASLK